MRPRTGLVWLLAAAALAGCSNAHRVAKESAHGTVDTLLKTCAADRPQASIEALNGPAREAFARAPSALRGCLRVLGLHPAGNEPAARRSLSGSRVVSVDANDRGARAVIEAPGGSRSTVEVENVGGGWRVAHAAR